MLMSEKYCSFAHYETFGSICLAGDSMPQAANGNRMRVMSCMLQGGRLLGGESCPCTFRCSGCPQTWDPMGSWDQPAGP